MSSATGPSSPVLPAAAKADIKAKKIAAAKKTSKATASHPSWRQIITECIAANPDDARQGVSRSTIKKYAEQKYNINTSGSNIYQLNRAIANGVEKGTFVLPKGPSGKVKLAPKSKSTATKENSKPLTKKPSATTSKKPVVKKAPATTKVTKSITKKPVAKAATTKKTSSAKTDAKKTAVKKAASKPKAKASASKSKKVTA